MVRRSTKAAGVRRISWRKLAMIAAGAALLAGAGYWVKTGLAPSATAQPADISQAPEALANPLPAGAPLGPPSSSDYGRRVVAYIYETEPITRAELGEYLIARHGPEKLQVLTNMKIIDHVCRQAGIEVTAADVEAAIVEDLQGQPDQANVLKSLLSRYHMNLEEWKAEVVRPRLQLAKLCRHEVHVSPAEVEQAFQAAHGVKVECRVLIYPSTEAGKKDATKAFAKVRNDDKAFDEEARKQPDPDYAAYGGKIKPFGMYAMQDPHIDQVVFRMRPGEVSEVVATRQGYTIFKCDGFVPPDGKKLDDVRKDLEKDLTENKVNALMKEIIPDLKKQSRPKVLLVRDKDRPTGMPVVPGSPMPPPPNQVVAYYNGNMPITREELGEYLIHCFGAASVEFLVNHRIIDKECAARGVSVSDAEIEAAFKEDIAKVNATAEVFAKEFLAGQGKTLYEYLEDAVRYRLLLAKLSEGRVRITEEDIRMAHEAYHGEKVECRMILWPPDQKKFVLKQYPVVRDSEEAFAKVAKGQASASLAAKGGKLPPIGRHTLGDDNLEAEAFRLHPGEVSTVIGTPQGEVVLKCDKRMPPDGVKLEDVRDQLVREVHKRKVEREIQLVFRELAEKAQPKMFLHDQNKPVDLKSEVRKELANLQGGPSPSPAPAGDPTWGR
jgi:parvulin-like peptidyl-prolyl isomerase